MLLPHIKLFLKIKRDLELVPLLHFLHNFRRKIFILLYSINWPSFIVWLHLLVRYWAICVLQLFAKDTLKAYHYRLFLLTSCCSRLRPWVDYFIFFKFTRCYLMFLMDVNLTCVLLFDAFNVRSSSIKEAKPLNKGICVIWFDSL